MSNSRQVGGHLDIDTLLQPRESPGADALSHGVTTRVAAVVHAAPCRPVMLLAKPV